MRTFSIIFALLFFLSTAHGQSSPFIWGSGTAKNLTDSITYKNNVTLNSGSVDPTVTATPGNPGSIYISTSGTAYIKQDSGSSTNWLPFSASAGGGGITAINAQSGPTVTIQAGTSGTDFAVSSSANTITLNLPTASASNRGALSTSDWSTFNNKQAAITGAATTVTSSNLTANRAVISNGSGKIAASTTTDTELGYVSGVTSAIQAQIDGKEPSITVLPIAKGGTNSSAALNNNRVMQSLGDAVVEAAAITPNRALVSDANGIPTHSTVTNTELGYVSGVTSAIQTQLNGKEASFSLLPLSKGGSNKSISAAAGQVLFTDADSFEALAAGSSGQVLQSNAAAAPSWVNKSISGKGQEDASAVTLEQIQAPNHQLTQTGTNTFLVETGNKNLLQNPGMENTDAAGDGWNYSGTPDFESSVVVEGEQSLKLTYSSATVSLYQDSTAHAAQFADGVQGVASVRIKTSLSGISVCSRNAGATSTNCATVNSDNKWMLYKVPFVLGATSNGISIASSGAVTGDVYVDDAYLGTDAGIADVSVVTPWQSYTPTFTGFGTAASVNFRWRQVGSNVEIQGRFTVGTPTATEARISLPNSYTALSSFSTIEYVGDGIRNASTNTNTDYAVLAEPSLSYLTFGLKNFSTSGGAYEKQNGNAITASGNVFGVKAIVPVNELSGSTQVFASQCGANCENVLSAYVVDGSTTTTVSEESPSSWVNGNCTNPSAGTYSCTLDTGIFTVAPHCWAVASVSATRIMRVNTSATTVDVTTTSDAGAGADTNFFLYCKKQGADYQSSRQIIGSFKEVEITKGSSKPIKLRARVDCDSSSSIQWQQGNWISSIGNISTGSCSISFNGAQFSDTNYQCHANYANSFTGNVTISFHTKATNSISVKCVSNGSNCTAADPLDIFCSGDAP